MEFAEVWLVPHNYADLYVAMCTDFGIMHDDPLLFCL